MLLRTIAQQLHTLNVHPKSTQARQVIEYQQKYLPYYMTLWRCLPFYLLYGHPRFAFLPRGFVHSLSM